MNTYKLINSSTTIGDSLSSININYLNLETDFFVEKLSADNLWSVMSNYYQTYSPFLKGALTMAQKTSAVVLNTCTVVENNSAGWVKPITIFYPSLFPSSTQPSTILSTLSSWVNSYFPTTDVTTNTPNYIENQIAVIYAHSWQYGLSINENQYLRDSTACSTANKRVCAYCKDVYYGGTWCGTNSWADCGGRASTCQNCQDLTCYYKTGPYVRMDNTGNVAQGFISANVNMSFQDRNELSKITAVVFKVKNCSWRFDRNISTK
jgi:hypothetical protein